MYAVLQSKDHIKDDEPSIVNYSDFSMNWNYPDFKQKAEVLNFEGAVPSYSGFHPHLLHGNLYAGVKIDKDNNVLDIQEKHRYTDDPMDTWHSGGTYYFRKGSFIKKYFQELMDRKLDINGEYYVSMVYQLMLRDNLPIYMYPITHFCQWGTPQDLEEYKSWSKAFTKRAQGTFPDDQWHRLQHQKSFLYWKEFFAQLKHHPYA